MPSRPRPRLPPFAAIRLSPLRPRTLTTTTHPLLPENPPAATSTSAAQPFSTPFTPSPANTPGLPTGSSKSAEAAQRPKSSIGEGAVLRGLTYMKNQGPVLAREDHEYPEWLWGILDSAKERKGKEDDKGEGEGDAFAKSKNQRRLAAKAARAHAASSINASDPLNPFGGANSISIPLDHQSIDLPAASGTGPEAVEAMKKRGELTTVMRERRRKGIREANFLKGMK